MESMDFEKELGNKIDVSYFLEPVIEELFARYSADGEIKKFYFNEFDGNEPIMNSILYSGTELLHFKYFLDNSEVKVVAKIFGNDKNRLEQIKEDLNQGLEKLL